MISAWFISIATNVFVWALSLTGGIKIDSSTLSWSWLGGLASLIASMSVWVPWWLIVTVTAFSLGVWLLTFTARIVRALIGHVPLVGGNG